MQFKKTILRLLLILFPAAAFAQTTYLPQGDKAYILLERLEIKASRDSTLNFSKTKPYSRQSIINGLNGYANRNDFSPSQKKHKTDWYNLESLYKNNVEFVPDSLRSSIPSFFCPLARPATSCRVRLVRA